MKQYTKGGALDRELNKSNPEATLSPQDAKHEISREAVSEKRRAKQSSWLVMNFLASYISAGRWRQVWVVRDSSRWITVLSRSTMTSSQTEGY